jgi:predicted O-methyltransferase YrrM
VALTTVPRRAVGLGRRAAMVHPARRLRRASTQLLRDPDAPWPGAAAPVARALRDTAHRRPDEASRRWIERLEDEREHLRASSLPLSGGSGTRSTVGEVTRRASVSPLRAALLFHLVRAVGARRCLELGTCVGISGAYVAAAMQLGGGGRLDSLEGHADRAAVARDSWRRLGLEGANVVVGRFHQTLPRALAGPAYDLVFVDGDHDGHATVGYVTAIREASRPGTVLVLDDIDWSRDMRAAWSQLRTGLTGSLLCDLGRVGLIRLGPGDAGRSH